MLQWRWWKKKKLVQVVALAWNGNFLETVKASVNYFWMVHREKKKRGTKCPQNNARISWFLRTLDLAISHSPHLVWLHSPTASLWKQQKASNVKIVFFFLLNAWFIFFFCTEELYKELHHITNRFHIPHFSTILNMQQSQWLTPFIIARFCVLICHIFICCLRCWIVSTMWKRKWKNMITSRIMRLFTVILRSFCAKLLNPFLLCT